MMPIPSELRDYPHWVGYRNERRRGEHGTTKVPYVLGENGRKARANDPSTWRGFDAAEAFGPQYDGIGFELSVDDPFSAVDLDLCIDKETGTVAPWAREIVRRFASYTEITPSGEGLRIFCTGQLPRHYDEAKQAWISDTWINKRLGEARADGKTPGCELYSFGKYLTVTGNHLAGTPETVNDAQAALDWLIANPPTLEPKRPHLSAVTLVREPLTDAQLIKKACAAANGDRFARLWLGDTSAYGGDESRADSALCWHLAYWTDGDAGRMDRLFRQSGLMRPKWDELRGAETYGEMTIRKAIREGGSRNAPTVRLVQERPEPEPQARIADVPEVCWRGWFADYRDTVAPTTEAPDVYHLGAAFVMAGAVLKRLVWVEYGGPVYPNVYCILVGASGRNRKDTAIKRALPLLDPPDLRQPVVSKLNTVTSAEGLIERLAQGRSVVLHLSEVSILLRNAKRESTSSIIPWLTTIFDSPPVLELPSRKNPVTAHNPFLCILGGTTPEWFDTDVDEDMIRGGFLGRFLYLNGEPKPAIDLPPRPNEDRMRALREYLYELRDRFDRFGGREFALSDAATAWWRAWYAQESRNVYFGDLDVLFQRVHLYVMKIALLYATLEEADYIEPEHLEAASAFVRLSQAHVEASHPKWGASLDAKLTNKIMDFLRERGGKVTRRELHQRLSGRVAAPVFGNVLRTMAAFHRIELPDEKHVALPGYGDAGGDDA